MPVVSSRYPEIDIDAAYLIQAAYVANRLAATDRVAGFKAGATTAAVQQGFGLSEPLTGILLAAGMRTDGGHIAGDDFGTLLLETELGFRFGKTLNHPVADIASLQPYVENCFAAIELADAGLFGSAKTTGVDLIAGNSAAAGVLIGESRDWHDLELDAIRVTLEREGDLNQQGCAGDVMNGQWHALLWLANRMLARGFEIAAGHIFLTGAIGRPHPGSPGEYIADYGEFGRLVFTVS